MRREESDASEANGSEKKEWKNTQIQSIEFEYYQWNELEEQRTCMTWLWMYLLPFYFFHKWMCLSRWCERLFCTQDIENGFVVIIGHWSVQQNNSKEKK